LAENKEHRRPEAIPLPDTLRDALSRPSRYAPYVSHSVKAQGNNESPGKSELTTDNHAFYVGKMVPYSFGEKVRKLLGWGEVDGRIYTPEVIEGLLNYAARHLEDGEKVHFVIAPALSELFNGPKDIGRALSSQKEIELIRKIAGGEFFNRFGTMPLEITDIEEEPLHKDLFAKLRSSVDPETKIVDSEKAFETEEKIELSENASSLQIARFLYKVSQEDDRFNEALRHAVPGRLKESDNTEYYALTEIAIRLAEILNGRFVHGGVERQEVYDVIVERILKGKKGSYKNIEAFEPLFKLFEGKRFETVHLKTGENYYELKKKRNLARVRILLIMALAGGGAWGAYEGGRYQEKKEQKARAEQIDRDLKSELFGIAFHMDSPHIEISKERNVEIFHEIVNEALKDIGLRYRLSQDILEELKPFLQRHFLEHKNTISTIHAGNNFLRIDLEDLFIRQNALFFKNKGIKIEKPYQSLIPYTEAFKALLASGENLTVSLKNSADANDFESIGTFYSGQGYNNEYGFYWYDSGNKRHLVAKSGTKTYYERIEGPIASSEIKKEYSEFSSEKAKEGARQFLYSVRRFDAVGLLEYESLLFDLRSRKNYEKPGTLCKDLSQSDNLVRIMGTDKGRYKDSFGEFDYELVVGNDSDAKTFLSKKCLLARDVKAGEPEFTNKTAHEMADRYFDMDDKAVHDYNH
jgi:hypothetical protein